MAASSAATCTCLYVHADYVVNPLPTLGNSLKKQESLYIYASLVGKGLSS